MKILKIEYRYSKDDRDTDTKYICVANATNPEVAIKKAGIQDAHEYNVSECTSPIKLVNKSYSRRNGTYNAMWIYRNGSTAYWGNYCTEDGSYCLNDGNTLMASGAWNGNRFETFGRYNYEDVRKALQLGFIFYS